MGTSENIPFYVLGGSLIILVSLLVYVMLGESVAWEKFKTTHECKVVAQKQGEIFNTFNSAGKVGVAIASDQTAYLCDDNITYWR